MVNDVHGRLNIPVQPIAKQAASDRVKNWDEVYHGFELGSAIVEAGRMRKLTPLTASMKRPGAANRTCRSSTRSTSFIAVLQVPAA